jgi:N6-adenosine-specific RNA methylase IME4
MAADRYSVITADPPWKMRDQLPGPGRGASKHYGLLSVDEIARFPLPPMADDAVLFLWRLAAMQEEALFVCKAWGFELKTEMIWLKRTVNGKRWFGMGRIVRAEHEVALVATRGHPKRLTASVRSAFEAQVGRHSEKPEAFYDIVERLYDGPYVELFARRLRTGWTCLGLEAEVIPF